MGGIVGGDVRFQAIGRRVRGKRGRGSPRFRTGGTCRFRVAVRQPRPSERACRPRGHRRELLGRGHPARDDVGRGGYPPFPLLDHPAPSSFPGRCPVKKELAEATHVYSQDIGALDQARFRELVPTGARVFHFPDIAYSCAWQFDGANGFTEEAACSDSNAPIHHQDGVLGKLRSIEPDKKRRIRRYRDLDFEWAAGIDRVIEAQERFLVGINDGSDLRLGRFIAERGAERQPSCYCTHPSEFVFQRLCEYCWEQRGLPGEAPIMQGLDSWREWSVPVHPAIARRLGLRWADDTTRYSYGTLGDVTWLQCVGAYVEAFG